MGSMMQTGMLAGIIGSACCVLAGIVVTVIRAIRIVRRERAMAFWLEWQLSNMETCIDGQDAKLATKHANVN